MGSAFWVRVEVGFGLGPQSGIEVRTGPSPNELTACGRGALLE